MAYLGDAEALALEIEQRAADFSKHFRRQHRRTGTEMKMRLAMLRILVGVVRYQLSVVRCRSANVVALTPRPNSRGVKDMAKPRRNQRQDHLCPVERYGNDWW